MEEADRPKAIIIQGGLSPEDVGVITKEDYLEMRYGGTTTEILSDTEEARKRILAVLEAGEYTILEQ